MSNASYSVVPQGSAYITNFDPDVIANRGYMTTEEMDYMAASIAGASRRVDMNRADVNSLHVAAGWNTGDGDIEDPDSDSDSSGDEDEIPYHAARILMVKSGVPPSRIEAIIESLRLYTSLAPSEQDVIRAKLAADVDADESSTSRSTAESTHPTADLVFRRENIKFVSLEDCHDIPRAVINLAKLKIHVPLTLLTFDSMKRIHAGDDISCFPPEETLPLIEFYQASGNFIKLMSLVADPVIVERFKQHRSFCLSHMERYRTVLAFDMEMRRIFFNTESFLAHDAYLRRWHAMDLDIMDLEVREAVEEGAAAVGEAAKSGHLPQVASVQQV